MRFLAIIIFSLPIFFASCKKVTEPNSKTTSTQSSEFTTLNEKQEFLERYVTFRRNYDDLSFNISYIDGGGGSRMVPGPTEWDVRIFATVPSANIEDWTKGLSPTTKPILDWVTEIPKAPVDISDFKWYEGDKKLIGINREDRMILYRIHSN